MTWLIQVVVEWVKVLLKGLSGNQVMLALRRTRTTFRLRRYPLDFWNRKTQTFSQMSVKVDILNRNQTDKISSELGHSLLDSGAK